MPKASAFDTGFMGFSRGWDLLRPEDYGVLWEHFVLEYLQAHGYEWKVQYWRDKAGRKVDFVIARTRDEVDAIECKWDTSQFDAAAAKKFRSYYPHGKNYLVSPLVGPGYSKKVFGLDIHVCNPDDWLKHVKNRGE